MSESVPVSIGRPSDRDEEGFTEIAGPGEAIGHAVAGMLRHLVAVLDREDRLEAGTGAWLGGYMADPERADGAVRSSVLRALRMAVDPVAFRILDTLHGVVGLPIAELAALADLDDLAAAELVSDLVSAGLVVKLPEAGQVAGTAAGAAIVDMVRTATATGAADLRSGR